jgi:hypothetical protein
MTIALATVAAIVAIGSAVVDAVGNVFLVGFWLSLIYAGASVAFAMPHRVVLVLVFIQLVLNSEQAIRAFGFDYLDLPDLMLVREPYFVDSYLAAVAAAAPPIAAATVSHGWPRSQPMQLAAFALGIGLLVLAVISAAPLPGAGPPSPLAAVFVGYGVAAIVAAVKARWFAGTAPLGRTDPPL